ncbi:MAG: adenylyl-sulfate kinase [Betaproteobacteria bacterium]|nr:adenylyl-sulfate kinase [Betaproteobacteria bacterium]
MNRPVNRNEGVVILLTGLPAAGKTTLAKALAAELENGAGRAVTLLDGDEVRRLLSSELGYSREHRRLNVLRHAYVAAEICRHGGVAVCALIAPYAADRAEMRRMVSPHGRFVQIYVATPLEVCEERDPKGLYARARAGNLAHMTGIDDPYEPPQDADIVIDTSVLSVTESLQRVCGHLALDGTPANRR